ncbi:MAG: nascent polypeptide-associated complex protein [Candidatus Pacearchaeota archaeon]
MFPGIDPKRMQSVMKQMGISHEEIEAKRVIIENDEKNIIIENPSVIKIKMQGQINFQISGDIREELIDTTEEDIQTIIEKTGVTKEKAKSALEKANGDLTEAILSLS